MGQVQRYWKVINPKVVNSHGEHPGYKLVPGINALPFQHPHSHVGRRAGFMYHHFWARPFSADELDSSGTYPNQYKGGGGLPACTARDRSLVNQDVVVWYVMNYHYLPRPEDWLVQPCVYANFHWMPAGFFTANPALGVPAPKSRSSCC